MARPREMAGLALAMGVVHKRYEEMPRSLAWLWRGYDSSRQQEIYVMDPEEQKKPMFRVRALNRE